MQYRNSIKLLIFCTFCSCEESRCFATDDKNFLPSFDQFDAIIMHEHDLNRDTIPNVRNPDQIYVFVANEAPLHRAARTAGNFSRLNGIFNFSISYRMDSDIWSPYGHIQQVRQY